MAGVLYLFPDTQLFFQCRPLEQIDWRPWKGFDEVHLIVSRPVQVEIDDHKGKGSNRRSDRARKASRLIRDIIISADKCKTIRAKAPTVKLFVQLQIEPSSELTKLNYARNDHQLVGIAHAFSKENEGADVRVLTDDGGVIATADMVAVPFEEIPETWLVSPETSDEQKRIAALQSEVDRLKAARPVARTQFLDPSRSPVDELEIVHPFYQPLGDEQIAELVERLRDGCPIATDFGSADEPPHLLLRALGTSGLAAARWGQEFVPATDEKIVDYRDTAYPKWLDSCHTLFGSLHEKINAEVGWPTVWFSIKNEGTRPGKDVLVTITTAGGVLIKPPKRIDPDDKKAKPKAIALPAPPVPPRGEWRQKTFGALHDYSRMLEIERRALGQGSPMDSVLRGLQVNLPEPFDPNWFYLKTDRPKKPVTTFSRHCQQWRHSIPAEDIGVELFFDRNAESVAGLLECQVHAENLVEPSIVKVPIRIVIQPADTYQSGTKLVEKRVREATGSVFLARRLGKRDQSRPAGS